MRSVCVGAGNGDSFSRLKNVANLIKREYLQEQMFLCPFADSSKLPFPGNRV